MPKIPTIEELLKAGAHFGHRVSKWNPKMEPFIFTSINNVHIIDLIKTQKMLEKALDFIKKIITEKKTIVFVGTKDQIRQPLKKMAEEINSPYIITKWIGGCFTNFVVIKKLIKKYNDLVEEKISGKLKKYTKKEQHDFDMEIKKLETKVGGLKKLTKLPDALFVWDVKKEKTAITEANKKNIPIIAVCDTNVNPQNIDYVIPMNDDATKAAKMVFNLIKETVLVKSLL